PVFRTRSKGSFQSFTANVGRRFANGRVVSRRIAERDSGHVAVALWDGRRAGYGAVFHVAGGVGAVRAGANGELADGRRLWRTAHNFWFHYCEEVRWLNKQRCGAKYLKINTRSKSCKAYVTAAPHTARTRSIG